MGKRIILFGGSFDPPGLHHEKICIELHDKFPGARIIVVPCGYRKDKNNRRVSLDHRINMINLGFSYFNVEMDLFDLKNDCFTPTHELDAKYSKHGEVWHYIGTDIISGGAKGESEIHKVWARGEKDFNKLKFIVGDRFGTEWDISDLPPRSIVFDLNMRVSLSSTLIRDRIAKGDDDFLEDVQIKVYFYIKHNRLYKWPKD